MAGGCCSVESLPSPAPTNDIPQDIGPQEPRVIIDHQYFPHIIELILSFLPYPGLICCTAVCRDWRQHARNRLFDHVAVFERYYDGGLVEVWSRSIDWPHVTVNLISPDNKNYNAFKPVYTSQTVDMFYFEHLQHSPERGLTWNRPKAYARLLQAASGGIAFPPREELGFTSDDVGSDDVVRFIRFDEEDFSFGEQTGIYPNTVTITVNCCIDPTEAAPPKTSAVWPEFEWFHWEVDCANPV